MSPVRITFVLTQHSREATMLRMGTRYFLTTIIVPLIGLVLFISMGFPLQAPAKEQAPEITSRGVPATTESAFLSLGGIKGKATTTGFENQIVITNLVVSLHNTREQDGTHTGGGSITLVKDQDPSSPFLTKAFRSHQLFPLATLVVAKKTKPNSSSNYIKVTLEKVIVSSVGVGFSTAKRPPTETVKLTFERGIWEGGTPRMATRYFSTVKP